MKTIVIIQSNYIPWKGYFDLIGMADEVILYDDMQYTRRDWRNRNRIRTPHGTQWLTVPVQTKGKYLQKIRETEIVGSQWQEDHWRALCLNYGKAAHFAEIEQWLKPLYLEREYRFISVLNRALIEAVCAYIGIPTLITNSWNYSLIDGKSERLAKLCSQAGGTQYLSGPSARDYIDESVFANCGISVAWADYTGYPDYPQQWGNDCIHDVTILDLLMNCGKDSVKYMKFAASATD